MAYHLSAKYFSVAPVKIPFAISGVADTLFLRRDYIPSTCIVRGVSCKDFSSRFRCVRLPCHSEHVEVVLVFLVG